MRGVWVLLLALAACEDSSRPRDRDAPPRLQPKNAPGAPTDDLANVTAPGQIRVVMTASGDALVDGAAAANAELERVFREAVQRHPHPSLELVVPKDVPYARVIAVMDLAQAAGLSSIGLAEP